MELLSPEWWAALLAIIIVDLLLAGDNAVVIALAARNLPPHLKKRAVIWGTMGAIFIRVILVFFVSKLLLIPGVSFVGGLLLYAIAWKLLNEGEDKHKNVKPVNSFAAAMGTIIVADTVMGLDNILAIAGAARGDLALIIFGLGLSIPIMMGGSVLILKMLEKAPWLVVAGSALLSGIAGGIVLSDKWLQTYFKPDEVARWALVLGVAALVTAAALWWKRRHRKGKGSKGGGV